MVVLALGGAGAWALTTEARGGSAPEEATSEASDLPTADPTSDDPTAGAATPMATPSAAPSTEPTTPEAMAAEAALQTDPQVQVARQLEEERGEPTRALERLRTEALRVVRSQASSLEGSRVSVAIRDAQGRRVLDHGPAEALLPASTMKAVTAATVLSVLGPEHRFRTTVAVTGPVEDGVLRGDLVLVGGGDPALSTEDYRRHIYPSRPATSLEVLADAVADAGIRRVTGRVVGDASAWGGSSIAAGWRPSYLDDQNARRITSLTVDAGLDVKVEVPEDAPVQVELHGSPDPARRTALALTRMLRQRDIRIPSGPRTSDRPVDTRRTLGSVTSPPVDELLRFTMERSDNHLADSLLRAAAHAASGDGSWSSADRTARTVLEQLGVDPTGLRVADGSGLSRLDRLSAAQLADLDVAMMRGPAADAWQDSLAVTGREGTLRYRLRGTAADGRFYGKTGTLDDVKAVVGHVVGADGSRPRLHLSVVANGTPSGGMGAVSVLMDRLQIAMIDHLDGCSTTWEEFVPTRTCASS